MQSVCLSIISMPVSTLDAMQEQREGEGSQEAHRTWHNYDPKFSSLQAPLPEC